MQTYRDLIVWQKGIDLVTEIYRLTNFFPADEKFGLSSQMRRAAVSIPSNIAEGKLRGTQNEFHHFLRIAYGSGGELETQIEIAKRLFPQDEVIKYEEVNSCLIEIMKMLNTMISNLRIASA